MGEIKALVRYQNSGRLEIFHLPWSTWGGWVWSAPSIHHQLDALPYVRCAPWCLVHLCFGVVLCAYVMCAPCVLCLVYLYFSVVFCVRYICAIVLCSVLVHICTLALCSVQLPCMDAGAREKLVQSFSIKRNLIPSKPHHNQLMCNELADIGSNLLNFLLDVWES